MQAILMPWGEMTYWDTAAGTPAVLFLHGSGCDSDDWERTIRRLPPEWRILQMDFRGHGRSAVPDGPFTLNDLADDVLALLAHAGVAGCWLVGHSLGGMVAMRAAEQSDVVQGLILVEGWTSLVGAGAFGGVGRMFGQLPTDWVEAIKERSTRTQQKFDSGIWVDYWRSVAAFDGWNFLRQVRSPVVEIYGTMGRTPGTQEALLVPDNPLISWHWIEDAGHYIPLERPAAVAEVCRQHIGKE